jgi:transcriptional regulator with XRE-family HTH domain
MIDPPGQRTRPLLRTTLGGVLRRIRLQQGRTLAEVARRARVSLPYLSELERGRKEASSEVLAAVCEALQVELPDVLAEVRREMLGIRTRRPALIRLTSIGDAASVVTSESQLPDGARQPGGVPGPDGQRGSSDAVCLLAA